MTRSSAPSWSTTLSRMIADPRMWPASRKVAWIPGATSSSCWYATGRNWTSARSASLAV